MKSSFHTAFNRWMASYHAFVLLGTAASMLLIGPLAQQRLDFAVAEGLLMLVAIPAAVRSVSLSRWQFLVVVALGLLWLVLRIHELHVGARGGLTQGIFILLAIGALMRLVRDLLKAREVDLSMLASALTGFLLLGIIWAQLYGLLITLGGPGIFNPPLRSRDHDTLLYFSFATLATIGYGDVVPIEPFARMLAVLEAVAGLFYNAVVIARLVSLYSSNPKPPHMH